MENDNKPRNGFVELPAPTHTDLMVSPEAIDEAIDKVADVAALMAEQDAQDEAEMLAGAFSAWTLKVKRLRPTATLPKYAHGPDGDAGLDLYCSEAASIPKGERVMVPTGIAIELPPYCEAQIRSRSGLALKLGLRVFQGVGTVDPSYRGEMFVMLENAGEHDVVHVQPKDRIAQMVVARYVPVEVEEVDVLGDTARGASGFGSTGK